MHACIPTAGSLQSEWCVSLLLLFSPVCLAKVHWKCTHIAVYIVFVVVAVDFFSVVFVDSCITRKGLQFQAIMLFPCAQTMHTHRFQRFSFLSLHISQRI